MVRGLFDVAMPLIVDEPQTKTLTAANLYSLDVFDAVSPLIQSFELLERSQNFAILIPSEKYLRGLNINRHDWLEYHISTFLVTFATVGDEALLLVNEVHCLGIDPRYCGASIVKSNKWVKDTLIPMQLDAIEKLIKPHRKTRNDLVHKGKIPSLGSLFNSGSLDQLKRISFALQHRPEAFPETMHTKLDDAFVKALIKINKGLDTEVCRLGATVWQLLTNLHECYNQRHSILTSNIPNKKPTN